MGKRIRQKESRAAPQRSLRHEDKFLLDAKQQAILQVRAAGLLHRDRYTDESGKYICRTLYFDDRDNSCLMQNIAASDQRSKYRLRYYDDNTDRILLEKKTKTNGLGFKDTCLITLEECQQLLRGTIPNLDADTPPIKKQLLTELRVNGMLPKVIVTYDRMPFVYEGCHIRVTFDDNLTSSQDIGSYLSGTYAQRPIMPLGGSLLEVKWDSLLPPHIRQILCLEDLQKIAFSKYKLCCTYHL